MKKINVSIVMYHNDVNELKGVIRSAFQSSFVSKVFLIDNSKNNHLKHLKDINKDRIIYIYNNANIGYGKGHNIAIKESIREGVDYHVVLNPDISFGPNLLNDISKIMDQNPEYGQLMPKIIYKNGEIQHLCRLIPTPLDYICKRYLPFKWAKNRSDKFMLKFTGYDKIMNVPILSGCFMFFKLSALQAVGLFDERYFMYPEDDDLTRRMHKIYQTIYYPYFSVQHGYAAAPYKSIKMHYILIKNMIKYFNKWGWFFDRDRVLINKETLERLGYEK